MLQAVKLGDEPLDLDATFSSGQVFRWEKINGWWLGWINRAKVALKKADNQILFRSMPSLSPDIIHHFFSLEIEQRQISESLPKDEFTTYLERKYSGVRILKQDYWECCLAYIISAGLSIKAINRILDKIALMYSGDEKGPLPDPRQFSSLAERRTNFLGRKWSHILNISRKILENRLNPEMLRTLPYEYAWKRLVIDKPHIAGIGPKVADCILLFSLSKFDSFPIDRWILRGLKRYYSNLVEEADVRSDNLNRRQYEKLSKVSRRYFGKYSGFLQEYLFIHSRTNS